MLPDSMNVGVIADNIKKLEVMVQEAGSELPTPGAGDTGKILKVGSDGYELSDEYSYIPPAYSETEILTGRKWIDGRDVYEIVRTGTFQTITETASQVVISGLIGCYLIEAYLISIDSNGRYHTLYNLQFNDSNGNISATSMSSLYSDCNYFAVARYVKPAPALAPGNEIKKKTSKKGE